MSLIVEKRSFKVPPCRIDKDLIKEVGKILEKEMVKVQTEQDVVFRRRYSEIEKADSEMFNRMLKEEIEKYKPHYSLEASSKTIKSEEVNIFADVKWPSDTNEIHISLGDRTSSGVKIELDLKKFPEYSEVSIWGEDATWVSGVANRLETAFKNNKLGYNLITEYWPLRVTLSILLLASISWILTPVIRVLLVPEEKDLYIFLLILWGSMFLGLSALNYFWKWLFPYFEFGEQPLQKRVRKWILAVLVGSGLLSALFLRLIGLA